MVSHTLPDTVNSVSVNTQKFNWLNPRTNLIKLNKYVNKLFTLIDTFANIKFKIINYYWQIRLIFTHMVYNFDLFTLDQSSVQTFGSVVLVAYIYNDYVYISNALAEK